MREKIGQMIMVGLDSTAVSKDLIELVKDYKVGNVILFTRNITDKNQTQNLCYDIHQLIEKETKKQAFISIDQEGGVVTRLSKDATNVAGSMLLGATRDASVTYTAGKITGDELYLMGINFDIAPVADVNSNPKNPVIGVRAYSSDKDVVAEHVVSMVKGLIDGKVMPCAKHFPGHGDTDVDSHLGLPVIDKSLEELECIELVPFAKAIENDIPAIMTTHILFPQIEKNNVPATMSKTILTDLLREKLKYNGLIVTDCMEMNAIKEFYGTAKGAVEAIKAGAEIVCISHTKELAKEAILLIEEAVKNGEIPMETIDKAVEKIEKYKKQFEINSEKQNLDKVGSEESKEAVKNMYAKGITKVSKEEIPKVDEKTLFIGSYPYRTTQASSLEEKGLHFGEYMANEFKGKYIDLPINPTDEEIEKITKQYNNLKIVYGLYNGNLNLGQVKLANSLAKKNQVIAISLRAPYDLELLQEDIHKVAMYEYTELGFSQLKRLLDKEIDFKGSADSSIVK